MVQLVIDEGSLLFKNPEPEGPFPRGGNTDNKHNRNQCYLRDGGETYNFLYLKIQNFFQIHYRAFCWLEHVQFDDIWSHPHNASFGEFGKTRGILH